MNPVGVSASEKLREAEGASSPAKEISEASKPILSANLSMITEVVQEPRAEEASKVKSEPEPELGAFLRHEGLHQAQLDEWVGAMHSALTAGKRAKRASADTKRIKTLERELRRKEKALAEAAVSLILQKKVHEIWGDEDDATEPRSDR